MGPIPILPREELAATGLVAVSAGVMAMSPFVASPLAGMPPRRRPNISRVEQAPISKRARGHSSCVSGLPADTGRCWPASTPRFDAADGVMP